MAYSQLNPAPQIHTDNSANIPANARSFLGRNLGLIVLVSTLVAAWMLVYTFTMFHPKYGAKATVIIKDSAITNRYVEPERYYAMQTTTSTSSNPVLNTMGLLKSEAISDALWAYFREKHPEELKRLKIKTQKDWEGYYQDGSSFIKAKNQPGTDLISIQFSWTQPTIAQESLTVVVKAFQDASRDLNKEEQISRTKFLSRQMGEIEDKLQAIRDKKSQYERQNATVSVKRESDDLAGSRMELSNKLAQLQGQAQGKENLVRKYQHMLGMSPEAALRGAALGQNSTMVKLQDELYRLQQLHSLMSSSLTDANPKVREVQAQIDQVRSNIEQEKSRVMGPFGSEDVSGDVIADSTRNTLIGDMLKAQGEAQDLRAQAARIEQRLGQVNSDIRNFPGTAIGLANIEQQEATLSQALDHLRQKVMEGKMKEAQTLSNVFIVDSPRLPEHPSFPNRTHLIVISILMALASGVSVAFIKEQVFAKPVFNPGYAVFPGQFYQDNLAENTGHIHTPQYAAPHGEAFDETDFADEDEPHFQPVAATNFTIPNVSPEPVHPVQPEVQVVPQTAVKNAPNADDVLGVNPPIEKVEVPVTGSLFDSLLPIAGPMARNMGQISQPELRRDLTQALPPVAEHVPVNNPVNVVAHQPAYAASAAQTPYTDDELLPPDNLISPELQSIRLASDRLAQAYAPAQAVPVMHAAPSATPAYVQDPLSVEMPVQESGIQQPEAIDEFPSLVLNESDFADARLESRLKSVEVGEPAEEESLVDPATTLYENQAKTMPLPRKRRVRSVPAFLLDDKTIDVQAEDADIRQPYELVPKKQRNHQQTQQQALSMDASDFAFVDHQPTSEQLSDEALFQDLNPIPTTPSANLANSNFPPMPAFVPPEFARHQSKGLFGGLFASKKIRQPELRLHPRNR